MTQPYLGEVRMFAGNFAPKHNAYCNGQLISIQQNAALFSLLGTYYGGNGTTTFGLPDLRGRIGVCMGQGNGLSNYVIGQQGGTESVTITQQTTPQHNHMMVVSNAVPTSPAALNDMPAQVAAPINNFWVPNGKQTGTADQLNANFLGMTGGSLPHENRMPALAISMIIALSGIFPSRN